MIDNPYKPPESSTGEFSLAPFRGVFFAINFSTAVFFARVCVLSLFVAESPVQWLGGLVFLPTFAAYALCEWLAIIRKNRKAERNLGYINVVCSALCGFALVSTVGEVVFSNEPPDLRFLLWFTSIGFTLTVYLATSGWCRLLWARNTFPVG